MNNKEQAMQLSNKVDSIINDKNNFSNLLFFDNSSLDVRLLSMNSRLDSNGLFTCSLETFTNDINLTTTYDIYKIKDINKY